MDNSKGFPNIALQEGPIIGAPGPWGLGPGALGPGPILMGYLRLLDEALKGLAPNRGPK